MYLIKTCRNGVSSFNVLSPQQTHDTNAAGVLVALQNSIESAKFSFGRKNWEVGVASNGASTNKVLYQPENASVVDHLIFAWPLSHELELALHDAFTASQKQMLKSN